MFEATIAGASQNAMRVAVTCMVASPSLILTKTLPALRPRCRGLDGSMAFRFSYGFKDRRRYAGSASEKDRTSDLKSGRKGFVERPVRRGVLRRGAIGVSPAPHRPSARCMAAPTARLLAERRARP
jgi:hypothetical protein